MDSMDSNDTIEFEQPQPAGAATGAPDPAGASSPAPRSGRTRRVVTSIAVSAVLLGGGAAIGVALTGGASAATGNGSTTSSTGAALASATTTAGSAAVGRCAKLVQRLHSHGHPVAATRLLAFCRNPLLRLALVGGAHGEMTFQTKNGPKTIAVERGTIQSVTSSGITVLAKDGTTWTWDFVTNTVVREGGQTVTRDKLGNGETVLVGGPVVGGAHDARVIRIRSAG
jgi:hypothetical protein